MAFVLVARLPQERQDRALLGAVGALVPDIETICL
jgi:hypothetical protein